MRRGTVTFVIICLTFLGNFTVHAQIDWVKHANNPVLTVGSSGSWDDGGLECYSVLHINNVYHMWYIGWNKSYSYNVGYATSSDGLTWTKHTNNPVLKTGQSGHWDEGAIWGVSVIYKDSQFLMWYTGANKDISLRSIGFATSTDGVNWTKYSNNPVLTQGSSGTWDESGLEYHHVYFDGSVFKMWFSGYDKDIISRLGYATSSDGISWSKHANNPVMDIGANGSWDEHWLLNPNLVFINGKFHMWYLGLKKNYNSAIGYATSTDGISWTKDANNPLNLGKGDATSWERNSVECGPVLYDSDTKKFVMWYKGFGYNIAQIGYASSVDENPINEVEISSIAEIPSNYQLFQNYPNPFNPETEIQFQIPDESYVTLKIYNTIGQNIVTLADRSYPASTYSVNWDGRDQFGNDVPSGIYFYQISTDNFKQIKKMTLMR